MLILALDLATTTGFCVGRGDVSPRLGHVRMPDTKEEVGPFLNFWRLWLHARLTEIIEEENLNVRPSRAGPVPEGEKPQLAVIFEAPLLPKAKIDRTTQRLIQAPTTISTTRKLQGLAGLTEEVCYERGIPVEEVYGQTVRKALGGSGRAEKPDMMAAAKRCGLAPKVHDEADAFGVWICAVRTYARQHQAHWDRRLYGARGLDL